MKNLLIKNKDKITTVCGIAGGICAAALTVINNYGIAVPQAAQWIIGSVASVCFGLNGYLIGKRQGDETNN